MSNLHPIIRQALQPFAPPADVTRSHIQTLEARVAELERQLRFKTEALAQFVAKYEELCPRTTEAELPDGSVVTAPEQVVHDAMLWLRGKHDLEFCDRIDEQTLVHFEVEKAEQRLQAAEDRQS